MKQKTIKNIFSLMAKLDISFAICLILTLCFYLVTYSLEHVVDDVFWVMLVLAILTTYYFLRQDVALPLTLLGENAKKINEGLLQKLNSIETDTPEFLEITKSYNRILANTERATAFIQQIESGNLEAELLITDNETSDKLSQALLNMRHTMRQIDEDEHKRNWATQGFAMLAEILRTNNQDVKGLSKHIMAGLVPYLEAIQGSIFVIEDSTPDSYILQMTGTYAYGRQKYLRKQIIIGKKYASDLVGQVFLEQASLILSKVPEGYLEISSGLGEAPPKNIILVPLVVDGNSYGVLEIASFSALAPYQVAFVERISESIALTIATVRINEQTKELLEESQRQAEQLKSQEEEMRQNVEELASTQEEMERKNRELEIANAKMLSNTQILGKSLEKAKNMQTEVAEKNAQMQAQEEEMRQNLEELVATQEELNRQKAEIEGSNQRLEANTKVLEKAYHKSKEDQEKLKAQNKQIEQQDNAMRQTLAELQAHQKDLESKTKKLETNEVILKKFMERANASDSRHKTTIRELQEKLKQYE